MFFARRNSASSEEGARWLGNESAACQKMLQGVQKCSNGPDRPAQQGMTVNVARAEKPILCNQVASYSGNVHYTGCECNSPMSSRDGIFKLLTRREKYNSVHGDYVKHIMIHLWHKRATLTTVMTCRLILSTYATLLIDQLVPIPCTWKGSFLSQNT
jgi:hypothetical protein